MSRVSFETFCQSGPCIEELEGFRAQRMKEALWTPEDQTAYLKWHDLLIRGKETPAETKFSRLWEYRRGKKPKKRKTHGA